MVEGHRIGARVVLEAERCDVFTEGQHYLIERIDPLAHVGEEAATEGGIRALMPGRVSKGAPLLILEAMKMEHTLFAPADGVCEAFNVAVGEQVNEGSELVKFVADASAAGAA